MKKKILVTVTVIIAVLAVTALWFRTRLAQMYDSFKAEEITWMDLSGIDDGVYRGEAGDFVVSVILDVTVEDHRITGIEMIEQHGGEGYEALEMLPRIVEAQSPDVDVVTGATGSSMCIMIAVRNALTGGISTE